MRTRKPPTMTDVAKRAGVSPATVSNVLAGRKAVDPDLVARVRQAAAELDYQIDRAASHLRGGKSRVIGILVPSLENTFFTSLIAAVERQLQEEGYDILVASANDDEGVERRRLAALLSWRPAGIIIVPAHDSFPNRDLLDAAALPYVVLDRVGTDLQADVVAIDNVQAGRDAATHLINLGHRDIWVVASALKLLNIRQRCDGVQLACREAGVKLPKLIEVGMTFEAVAESLEGQFETSGRPGAVIALTNFATMAVLAAFSKNQIGVPAEISLVGFDDYAWMSASNPSITAIRQPVNGMGAAAWNCLQRRIAGDDAAPTRRELTAHLKIRQSTRAVPLPIDITQRQ
ncbi:MAG TPA: LacI family DNA-binding transcriptional regulator [Terriglobales bacterium]|nr:LacI family DNA-binding transcriptional regulator [Terriglobales bacterium]